MPASSFLPKLCFGIAAALGLVLGLTTYTFPIIGRLQDPDVTSLIHRALGDSLTPLPGPPSALAIETVVPEGLPGGEPPVREARPAAPEPATWAAEAAARDSGALRDWLEHAGLSTGISGGDTVRTTLWRLTLHAGCPVISRLRTVAVREQLVAISSDCPRAGPGAVPKDAP